TDLLEQQVYGAELLPHHPPYQIRPGLEPWKGGRRRYRVRDGRSGRTAHIHPPLEVRGVAIFAVPPVLCGPKRLRDMRHRSAGTLVNLPLAEDIRAFAGKRRRQDR